MTADTTLSPVPDPTAAGGDTAEAAGTRYAGVPERLRPSLQAPSSSLFPTVDSCPGCHGELRCTTVRETVVFACAGCGSLWRFELGYVYRLRGAATPDELR